MSTSFINPNLKREKQKQTIQSRCACINSGYLRPQASLGKLRKLTRQNEHNTVYIHKALGVTDKKQLSRTQMCNMQFYAPVQVTFLPTKL